jgi:hypothetical protein
MGLTLAKIATNTASVTLHYGGEDIIIDYFPSRITGKMLLQMQALSTTEDSNASAGFTSLIETLCRLIKSWTLYEDAEETVMFPLLPDRLAELPIALISQAFNVIIADNRPEAQATQNGRAPR